MDTESKSPVLSGQKIPILFIVLAILIAGVPIFEPGNQGNEAWPADFYISESLEEKLVIIQGNSLLPVAGFSNPEPQAIQKILVVVTAYSSSPWETWGNPYITAAGTWVREGIVANNLLPFGTKIRIPEIYGDKIFVVEDRMNWKKGYYHVDIWFPSYWEAKYFGVKKTYIEILEG
jgi:3D (Asp-Asp-Asp) domain-containing protein